MADPNSDKPVSSEHKFRGRWTPSVAPMKSNFGFQGLNYGQKKPCEKCNSTDHTTEECKCNKCGSTEHITKECHCAKCQSRTHITSQCKCGKCGSHDHISAMCPCQKCGSTAHKTEDCPCLKCGSKDHRTEDCPCQKCGSKDHATEDCACQKCGSKQHATRDCACLKCGSKAHRTEDCPCLKCGSTAHRTEDCPCLKCGSTAHRTEDCPCQKCGSTAHRTEDCPCQKCGSTAHRTEDCACQKCGSKAHRTEDCPCLTCGSTEHRTEDCPCVHCGSVKHLNEDCPTLKHTNESAEQPVQQVVGQAVPMPMSYDDDMVACVECAEPLAKGDMFCNKCGAKQVPPVQEVSEFITEDPLPEPEYEIVDEVREDEHQQYDVIASIDIAPEDNMPSMEELRHLCETQGKETNFGAVMPGAEKVKKLTYKFEGGYAYLYRNDTSGDQAIYLEEKVKFGLTNMHIIDHENSDVYTVKLMPGKTDFIVIKQTRLDLAYNFKYESSIKSAPVKRVSQR